MEIQAVKSCIDTRQMARSNVKLYQTLIKMEGFKQTRFTSSHFIECDDNYLAQERGNHLLSIICTVTFVVAFTVTMCIIFPVTNGNGSMSIPIWSSKVLGIVFRDSLHE